MNLSVRSAALEAPDRVALIEGDAAFTLGELAARVEQTARGLVSLGLGRPGAPRAALSVSPTVGAIVALSALIEIGAGVALLDSRLPDAERARRRRLVEPVVDLDPRLTALARLPGREPAPATPPDDERELAVVFTSGVSGAPKAVVLGRAAFVASAAASAANLGWRDDDRWLLCLPPAHVGGLSVLTRCLLARRAVVVESRSDPATIAAVIAARDVTLASLVPAQLERLFRDLPAWRPPRRLRAVLLGGAPARRRTLEEAARRGVPVLCTYGLTECCSQVATQLPGEAPADALWPLRGVEIRVASGDRIQVRGPVLATGYLQDGAVDELPLTPEGWFETGDLGAVDEAGRLRVFGRADDMIVTGGEKVDPRTVEEALLGHPAVGAALVFGTPDEVWGEIVSAAIVLEPGHTGAPPDLADFLAPRLAPHQRPRRLAVAAELPRTASGKPDRRLAARELAPALTPWPSKTGGAAAGPA